MRKIYYKRFKRTRLVHFCPAPGYNCPAIPLGGINSKGCDYELVKVVKAEGCKNLKNRRVLISWGLNLPASKWPKIKQVLAFDIENPAAKCAEIVLGA
ncbi:MAG: hypothetical protein PHY02_10865 [Phycisphaerae bacterium]|nr:hypothetical protein [Phycisphaerae bacterium]